MKKFFILICAACLMLSGCSSNEEAQKNSDNQNKNYKVVFEENFDGEALNTDIWGYEYGHIRNNEPQYYTDREENVKVNDGNLIITCRAEDFTSDDGTTAEYTSGSINTKNGYSFTHGKIEMRAKLPVSECNATWPAFWLMGTSEDWPKGGEIDIVEMYGVNFNRYECNIHWSDEEMHSDPDQYYLGYINMMQEPYNQKISKELNQPLGNDWHKYGLEWTEKSMTFLFDDEAIGSFDISAESMDELHKPMYILLNLALTQEGDTTPLDNGEKLEYLIDYVKVYQVD